MVDPFTFLGWIGAILFIAAYFLLTIKVLSADRISYHIFNAIGGLCLVLNSWNLDDTPTLFVNFIWICIAIFSISKIICFSIKIKSGNTSP